MSPTSHEASGAQRLRVVYGAQNQSLIPEKHAHHSSQRTLRREQYSMRGTVRPQVQLLPEKAEEYYFDLWCNSQIFQWYVAAFVRLEAESKARSVGPLGSKYLLGLEDQVVIAKATEIQVPLGS
ncbi:hypothetical protein B0H13DRAFT_1912651 [Mycena leptocephala]|nr:hypothetical protein B0H13DRAFT_1912651 [Mycena leptocephala]